MTGRKISLLILAVSLALGCNQNVGDDSWLSEAQEAQTSLPRLERELANHGVSSELLNKIAVRHWILGDLLGAQALLAQAARIEPQDPGTYSNLLQILWQQGRYAEAVVHARKFLTYNTANYDHNAYARSRIEKFEGFSSSVSFDAVTIAHRANEFSNRLGMLFVRVPGGTFIMGSDSDSEDVSPAHRVSLSSYWIGKYEVTVAEYEAFLKDTGFKPDIAPRAPRAPTDRHPATGIKWHDAEAFCLWLSSRESAIYRLPTEAEWEFAARGTDGRSYPWGDVEPDSKVHGNWDRLRLVLQGGRGALNPVGSYPAGASPFGTFDMSGNASEWCLDAYAREYFRFSPTVNPFGPFSRCGFLKVQRGSSWRDKKDQPVIVRSGVEANLAYDHHGFRLVMIPK